jgi:hypothetical protein
MERRGSVWRKVKPTALYLNCLKKGHGCCKEVFVGFIVFGMSGLW